MYIFGSAGCPDSGVKAKRRGGASSSRWPQQFWLFFIFCCEAGCGCCHPSPAAVGLIWPSPGQIWSRAAKSVVTQTYSATIARSVATRPDLTSTNHVWPRRGQIWLVDGRQDCLYFFLFFEYTRFRLSL